MTQLTAAIAKCETDLYSGGVRLRPNLARPFDAPASTRGVEGHHGKLETARPCGRRHVVRAITLWRPELGLKQLGNLRARQTVAQNRT
jgi:hypothetical protein